MHVATITIDHLKVAGDLTDYVVAITPNSDAGWATLYATALEGGGDIRIFKAGGVTEIPRENVSFSVSAETGEIHAKFTGTLSGSVDTDIEIHADGTSSDYAVTATYGRNAVWSAHKAVYHMNEASGNALDSTSGGFDLTDINTVTSATGKIGDGRSFLDTNEEALRSSTLKFSTTSTFSCSFIFKDNATTATIRRWFNTPPIAGAINSDSIVIREQSSEIYLFVGTTAYTTSGRSRDWAGSFRHFVLVSNGTSTKLYENGSLIINGTTSVVPQTGLTIAGGWSSGEYVKGVFDESRVISAELSTDWITTEYNNQDSPTTFYSVASEGGVAPVQNSNFLMFM